MTEPTLYPFQVAGRDFLAVREGALLGDDPGLGKTIQSLCAVKQLPLAGPVLVISRPINKLYWRKMIEVWHPEAAETTYIAERAGRHDTSKIAKLFKKGRPGYLITHHEALRHSIATLQDYGMWTAVIADEAHRFNNRKAQMTACLWDIPSAFKWSLSGTPIDKNPADWWALLHWLEPEQFTSYWRFFDRWVDCRTLPFGGREILGTTDPEGFAAMLRPYVLKRAKVDVAPQLPPLTEEVIWVEMLPAQATLYRKLKKALFVELDGDANNALFIQNALQRFSLLQQAVLWPTLLGSDAESGKLQYVLETLRDTAEQVVVFTRWRNFALSLPNLVEGGASIVGGQNMQEREAILERFSRGDIRWLVGTIQAMSESVNLDAASHAIFVDLHPSTIKMTQAKQRIHRLTSTKPVLITYLQSPGTIDEHVWDALTHAYTSKDLVEGLLKHIKPR